MLLFHVSPAGASNVALNVEVNGQARGEQAVLQLPWKAFAGQEIQLLGLMLLLPLLGSYEIF